MKVLIDIEDVKRFILAHSEEEDECYGSERNIVGDPIVDFLVWAGKDKAAKEIRSLLAGECEAAEEVKPTLDAKPKYRYNWRDSCY